MSEPTCPPPPPKPCPEHPDVLLMPHWSGHLAKFMPRLVERHGGPRWVHEPCDLCDQERQKKDRAIRQRSLGLEAQSPFGQRFQAATFQNYEAKTVTQKAAVSALKRFCKDAIEGKQIQAKQDHVLFLMGKCGTGKTHLCEAAWKMLVQSNVKALAFERNDVLRQMKTHLDIDAQIDLKKYVNQICSVPMLILDDFVPRMFEKQTEADKDMTYELINGIYKNMTRAIITTNLNANDFSSAIGVQAASRFLEMREQISCRWEPRRPHPEG